MRMRANLSSCRRALRGGRATGERHRLVSPLATSVVVMMVGLFAVEATAKEQRIAVLAFDDTSSEAGWEALGRGLQSMLTTDLGAVGGITLVERARLAEVREELALGKSRAFDKKTVARAGKLMGATHLVVGSYSVVGPTMRIDARLIAVAGAKVVTTAEASGEKEAFFELEKTLAKRLAAGLVGNLPPRDRAELSRIHTADFRAFQRFSVGLLRAEEKRVAEARAALEDAARIDGRFDLARKSLAELDQLVADVGQRKKDAADVAAREKELELSAEAAAIAAWLGDLEKTARGRKYRDEALFVLAAANITQPRGLNALWERVDRFAVERRGEGFLGQLWMHRRQQKQGTLLRLRDRIQVSTGRSYGEIFPLQPGQAPPKMTARVFKALDHYGWRGAINDGSTGWLGGLVDSARRVAPSPVAALRMAHAALDDLVRFLGTTREPAERVARWAGRMRVSMLERYLEAMALDDATALGAALARSTDPKLLEQVEARLAMVRDLTAYARSREPLVKYGVEVLRAFDSEPFVHRGKLLGRELERVKKLFAGDTLEPLQKYGLARVRAWPRRGEAVHFGAGRAWVRQGAERLTRGGTDADGLTRAMRYYGEVKDADSAPAWAIMGSAAAGDRITGFFDLRPADDWWPRQAHVFGKRVPEVNATPASAFGVLVAVRDIQVDGDRRPTRALLVRLAGQELAIVDITGQKADRKGQRFEQQVLARATLGKAPAGAFKVEVDTSGGTIRASIGGVAVEANRPAWCRGEQAAGFYGVWFEGAGYVEAGPPLRAGR